MRWIIIYSLFICLVAAELNIPELLKNEKFKGSGVKARLSPKGINYVSSFLTNALITELVTVSINTAPVKIPTTTGDLLVNDMILGIHHAPKAIETGLMSPNIVKLRVKALNISAKAILGGVFRGDALILAPNVQADLNVGILKNFQGAPNLKIKSCKIVQNTPLTVTMPEGPAKVSLIRESPELLHSLLCSRVEFIIEERINARFGLLNPKVPLANINDDVIVNDLIDKMRLVRRQRDLNFERSSRVPRDSLISSFNVTRAENLALDYTIISDMRVTPIGLEIENSGEVSLRGRGGTPFGPVPVALPKNGHPSTMLQMVVSDFVPNSLMYHGHTIGLFSTRIDPTTPHFGPLMQTTCSLSSGTFFCLGDLFPTLKRLHPNQKLSLMFNTVQAPVIRFRSHEDGGIKFTLLGSIGISLLQGNKETSIAKMSIDVDANMKLRLTASTVRPKITLKTISLKTLSPGVLLQKELDDSVLLAREVLQRLVNDILKEGIPIPVHPLFKLQKPKVKVINRALLLQTNFILNERLLRQLTAADLRKRVIRA